MPTPVRARTTVLDDFELIGRRRAVAVVGGQKATIEWVVTDPDRRPVDLTPYVPAGDDGGDADDDPSAGASANPAYGAGVDGPPYPPVLGRLGEAVLNARGFQTVVGTIVDAPSGRVGLELDTSTRVPPAVYNLDLGILAADSGVPDYVNRLTVIVEPSGFSSARGRCGPPTRDEIRLLLRDSSPVESRLLDELQFDDAEIAEAIVRPIHYWNGALPPVAPLDSSNFPFEHEWKNGIIATLYDMAARWYQKNFLTASAGGVSVNDMDKAPAYQAAADKLWAEYKDWTRARKLAISASQCMGSVGSPYGLQGWYSGLGN